MIWQEFERHLVAVVHCSSDLSKDAPGLVLRQPPPLLKVVVQLPPRGQLHHHHDPVTALKHCHTDTQTHTGCVSDQSHHA